jgi:hypothetical protein
MIPTVVPTSSSRADTESMNLPTMAAKKMVNMVGP